MREILNNIPLRGNYEKWRVEKWFEMNVFKFLREKGYYCYHVPDLGMATRLVDAIIVDPQWVTFYVEFKKTDWLSWNIKKFEPVQIEFLSMLHKRWWEAYVMIYSTKTNTYVTTLYNTLIESANETWTVKLFE
jgi:hypothetical protein